MNAALDQPLLRRLTATRMYMRAEFGYGTGTEVTELFRSLAASCVQKHWTRVLIVAGDDDPASQRSLRNALTTMVLAGMSPDFRLAVVAEAPRVAHAYGNFQRDVSAAGIVTRLFDNEEDATGWLADPDVREGRVE